MCRIKIKSRARGRRLVPDVESSAQFSDRRIDGAFADTDNLQLRLSLWLPPQINGCVDVEYSATSISSALNFLAMSAGRAGCGLTNFA